MRDQVRIKNSKKGFTLIELSIVLVVIGILVGSVLVARTMIHSAQMRQMIQQYEQFSTALNAFYLKYGCKPGDCKDVVELGFDAASAGNGDGLIGQCSQNSATNACSYAYGGNTMFWEQMYFWYQLSQAGLIKENIGLPTSIPTVPSYSCFMILGNGMTPRAKLRTASGDFAWGIEGDIVYEARNYNGTLNMVSLDEIGSHALSLSTI